MELNILIVGYGNIGSKLAKEYERLRPDIYDPAKGFKTKQDHYNIAFLAVDSPMNPTGACDLSQVYQAVNETEADCIVLRSTVPPTTTENLVDETGKRIVYSPEFYGMTQHSDEKTFDFGFTILGGNKKDCAYIADVLQNVYDARHRFCITDSRTAELVKYMENTMLATKVSVCVQFYEIAKQFDVSYQELRELVLQDERIGRAHTFVYKDHPYWESHCFDKDLKALTRFCRAPFVESVIQYNELCKSEQERRSKEEVPTSVAGNIGDAAVLENLAEEAAELAHAALKMARILRGENPTPVTLAEAREHVIEEYTDVAVCAGELPFSAVDARLYSQKRVRWYERIRQAEERKSAGLF